MNKPIIPKQEVAELLERAVRGDVYVKLDGPSWAEVFDGTVTFLIDGQRVSFLLDGGNLDCAEAARWTDGRTGDFTASSDPLDLLSEEDEGDLETMLRAVSVLCCNYPEPVLN